MILDLTSLRDAIAQGEEALAYCDSDLARSDPRLAPHLRAAAIQAFEFTYERTIKTLRRFLTEVEADPGAVAALSFNDLVRRGYDLGLLRAELAAWREFRRDRGTTSHTYDAAKALAIFQGIPAFLAEARFLLASIEARQVHEPRGRSALNPPVDIREADLAIVWAILDAHLPPGAAVRVFGSRARMAARRGSDLDLAVDAGRPLTRAERHALADAFEDSDLPYTVDVVDARAGAAGFLAAITLEMRPLPDRPYAAS